MLLHLHELSEYTIYLSKSLFDPSNQANTAAALFRFLPAFALHRLCVPNPPTPIMPIMAAGNHPHDAQLYTQNPAARRSSSPPGSSQSQSQSQSQHRRGYQACDPCRKRKVKCDLGSKSRCIQLHFMSG